MPGHEVFHPLLREVFSHLRPGSGPSLSERLRPVMVDPDTQFDIFCRQRFVLLNEIRIVEGISLYAGNVPSVMAHVRDHISDLFPGKMSDIFREKRRNLTMPYASIAELKRGISSSLPASEET